METKKVSVIIPTYRRSDFLCRAIDSVLNQTYSNIEIIVVDDNGEKSEYRNENEKKLKKYSDKIVFLKHKTNMNGAAARNTGLKYASGDYISFLDDDDIYVPERLERMVNLLENNHEFDGCYSSVAYSYYGKIFDIIHTRGDGNFQLSVLKMENVIGTGSNLFLRRSIIDKIGFFDINFLRNQDIEYLVRFFEYGNIKEIDEVLVVKCKEDEFNFSKNIEIMMRVKELFFNKFTTIINKYENELNNIYISNYYPLYINAHKSKKFYKYINEIEKIMLEHEFKINIRTRVKCKLYKIMNTKFIEYLYKKKMNYIVRKNQIKYVNYNYLLGYGDDM